LIFLETLLPSFEEFVEDLTPFGLKNQNQ